VSVVVVVVVVVVVLVLMVVVPTWRALLFLLLASAPQLDGFLYLVLVLARRTLFLGARMLQQGRQQQSERDSPLLRLRHFRRSRAGWT
jgi:hypothetical protein